jgi:hypothetical protein
VPSLDFSNPVTLIISVALGVGLVALSVALWFQLQHRARRYGGGNVAAAAMAAAIVLLLVSIAPDPTSGKGSWLPIEIGFAMLFVALAAIYRPEQVVKLTGGPSLRYRALEEGRTLQLMVREHGGWSVARRNEEVMGRFEGLDAFAGPATERYVELLKATLFADPAAPGIAAKLEELASADAELRESLKARPMFERRLEKRAAELDGEPAAE